MRGIEVVHDATVGVHSQSDLSVTPADPVEIVYGPTGAHRDFTLSDAEVGDEFTVGVAVYGDHGWVGSLTRTFAITDNGLERTAPQTPTKIPVLWDDHGNQTISVLAAVPTGVRVQAVLGNEGPDREVLGNHGQVRVTESSEERFWFPVDGPEDTYEITFGIAVDPGQHRMFTTGTIRITIDSTVTVERIS